jgi:DNA-binding NtrC family response regulator
VSSDRILLIVDDDEEIGLLFEVFLRACFAGIHLAKSSAEAEAILGAKRVTHVVSDFSIGENEPLGPALLSRWRSQYPSIQYAAIFTGAADRTAEGRAPGVDEVFVKPAGFERLLSRLRSA